MAIDFQEEKNNNFNLNKIIIPVVVLVVIFLIFLFFKNGGFSSNLDTEQSQLFEPVNIDFELLASEKFRTLENLTGISVLPGFIDASASQTEPEIIEVGRENPFIEVSLSEIDSAIIKAIEKLETAEQINDMRKTITKSSLYTESEKQIFFNKLNEKQILLETPQEVTGETIENNNTPVEENYYKEW